MAQYTVTLYEAASGDSPVEQFLEELRSRNRKAWLKCLSYVQLLAEQGLGLPRQYSAHLAGDVWELRPEYGNVEYRLLYGSIGPGDFGLVHVLIKKGDKVPPRDIDMAADRIREMKQDHAEG